MSKRVRLLMVGAIALLPLAATACRIDVGNGCTLLVAEPGANIGVVCN
jgi:hypothetical protein